MFLFFVVLSIFLFRENCNFYAHSFILGFIASLAIVLIFIDSKKSWILSKYTMPIFLMHTIFAAPIRIILLKLNITNPVVHISIGLFICLAGPIIASITMNKVKYLDFVLYPTKYIRFGK